MKRQNVRTLSLIVVTFTYLLIGAAVFDALESDYEVAESDRLKKEELHFVRKYNITEEDMKNITTTIIKYVPHRAGTQWKFAGAFFFSTTVITTIGYGYSTPKTPGGKVFCMFYAMVGIPLNLIMFQSIGERLNIFVTFLLRYFKKCFRFRSSDVSQTNLIFVCMNMSSIVVAGGAYAFSQIEGWSYLDAFYYCIITLTTIGFGDYVALQRNEDLQKKPEYFIFSLLFILFGLAILSAAMNLLVLRFLTLNTEDERKDELEALAAIRTAVRLDGDVITSNSALLVQQTPANGRSYPGNQQTTSIDQSTAPGDFQDRASVCSCTCYNFRSNFKKRSKRSNFSLTHANYGNPPHRGARGSSRGSGTTNSIIAQLLQPVRVLQAMTQVHATKRNDDWLLQNTVFGQRRNSI